MSKFEPELLDESSAARIYATAWNTLEPDELIPWLAEDVIYSSQNVLSELSGLAQVSDYFQGKMKTLRSLPDADVFAELGETRPYPMAPNPPRPCVLLAQGDPDDIGGVVLFTVVDQRIKRIDLCTVAPHPSTAHRMGIYPGRSKE